MSRDIVSCDAYVILVEISLKTYHLAQPELMDSGINM